MNIAKVIFSQTNNPVALLTLACLLAMPATAQVINYAVSGSTAYVTSSSFASGNVVIASTYNGYPVTRIGDWAFNNCVSLTSVSIPDSVTSIGDSAFSSCTNLARVDFGNRVVSIGQQAFRDTALTSVVLPDSLSWLDNYIFSGCSNLTSVTLGHGITNVSYFTFRDCVSLTNVALGRSINAIYWLGNLPALATLTVNAGNPHYSSEGDVLFDKSANVVLRCPPGKAGSYSIPDSATSVAESAFSGCALLTDLALGNSITNIGNSAFRHCTSLTTITIPLSVLGIGASSFVGCSSLLGIVVDPSNPNFSSMDGVLFNQSRTALLAYPPGKAGGYAVPSGVSLIGDRAFENCHSLTGVTIGHSVTRLGAYAFQGCTRLTGIVVPGGITNIGPYAFSACGNPTPFFHNFSAVIENGIRSISPGMFRQCRNLTSIGIPDTVTNIGSMSFEGCYRLRSVVLPEGVISVGSGAFENCSQLTHVALPETLTTIASRVFFRCGLTNITIPSSVTRIDDKAFYDCNDLHGVYFRGDSPRLPSHFIDVFTGYQTNYYLPGTLGWSTIYADRPTAPWLLPNPVILQRSPFFGVRTNAFGFRVSWATNASVVLEACTNLAAPLWSPLSTNTLTQGWFYFSDSEWTNYPSRIYCVRSQ